MLPLNSLILIQYEEPTEKKTDSGLYVPPAANTTTAKDFLKEGVVIAVNPDENNIQVGDTVLFSAYAITNIHGVKDQILVRKEDIYAIK